MSDKKRADWIVQLVADINRFVRENPPKSIPSGSINAQARSLSDLLSQELAQNNQRRVAALGQTPKPNLAAVQARKKTADYLMSAQVKIEPWLLGMTLPTKPPPPTQGVSTMDRKQYADKSRYVRHDAPFAERLTNIDSDGVSKTDTKKGRCINRNLKRWRSIFNLQNLGAIVVRFFISNALQMHQTCEDEFQFL